MTKATTLLAALTLALGASTALAQVDEVPDDPEVDVLAPYDEGPPAIEGMGTGEYGFESPAGIPADPNSHQNRQVGPSPTTPTDPAAGEDPAARVPTDDLPE